MVEHGHGHLRDISIPAFGVVSSYEERAPHDGLAKRGADRRCGDGWPDKVRTPGARLDDNEYRWTLT